MQPFNFGIRQSSAESVDDNRSRYAPSSVYSGGVGPTDDSPALGQTNSFMSGALRGPYEEQQTPRFPPVSLLLHWRFPLRKEREL